jgi:hypothetical protein
MASDNGAKTVKNQWSLHKLVVSRAALPARAPLAMARSGLVLRE